MIITSFKGVILLILIFSIGFLIGKYFAKVHGIIHVDSEDQHSFIFQIEFFKNPKKMNWHRTSFISLRVDADDNLHEKYDSKKIHMP